MKIKESPFDMRLPIADMADFVEAGVLHLFSNGQEVAELSLVPVINGRALEVTSWVRKNDEVVGHVRGNGLIHLGRQGEYLAYWVEGKYDVLDSIIYFPGSMLMAQEYHGFVPDWSDRSFELSEDNQIVASTSVDWARQQDAGAAQRPEGSHVARPGAGTCDRCPHMAPAPRDIAFRSDRKWWGVCIPGSLPVGETRLAIRRGRLSVEFVHFTALNTGGKLPKAYLVADLNDPYDLLDADVKLCRERKELTGRARFHAWWARPVFCTWGEQCQSGDAWDVDNTSLNANNVRSWVSVIRQKTGVSDFTVIIDAPWFHTYGDFTADLARFGGTDGLHNLINELHQAGHRVLLWFTPFKIDFASDIASTEPDCLLLDADGYRVQIDERSGCRDFTGAVARNTLINNLRYCLSSDADCLDADGLKICFSHHNPHPALCCPRNPRWGIGDEHWAKVLHHIYDDAHRIKPDCLITTSGLMPYLAHHTDMLRLNDLFDDDVDFWFRRARLGLRLMPDTIIDADGWQMNHRRYPVYWMTAPVFAVPDVYHATRFDGGEPFDEADYRRLAAAWHVYLNAPVSPDQQIVVEPETNTFRRRYTRGPLAGQYAAISFERSCLVTFSGRCTRVTASRSLEIDLPVHAEPKQLEAVYHDGRRDSLPFEPAGGTVHLTVPDAASDIRYLELTF